MSITVIIIIIIIWMIVIACINNIIIIIIIIIITVAFIIGRMLLILDVNTQKLNDGSNSIFLLLLWVMYNRFGVPSVTFYAAVFYYL